MQRPITPTLALVIAGGLAAGIALARPAAPDPVPEPGQRRAGTEPASPASGYLGGPDRPDGGAAPPPGPPAAGARILIRDFGFSAGTTVDAGHPITVANGDGVAHTLTAEGGLFDTGDIAGGGTATVTAPAIAGTYTFFCTIHPSMRGSVTVR